MPYNVLLGKMVVGISFVQLFQCNDNIIEKKKTFLFELPST